MPTTKKVITKDISLTQFGYAGVVRRATASFLDSLIIGILGAIVSSSGRYGVSLSGLVTVAYTFYFWIQQDGQTLGKRAMGIKIVRLDHKPMDIASSIIRYLGYIVSGLFFGLGYLWAIFDPQKQTWHDKMAKTIVVNTDNKSRKGLMILINLVSTLALVAIIAFMVFIAVFASTMSKTIGGEPGTLLPELQKLIPTTPIIEKF